MPAHDADEHDPIRGGSRVGHNAMLKLPTVVSDEPLRHEGAEWLKAAETQLIASQMLAVASGGEPMSCQLIEDYDLVDYPELPEDHRDFYKRNTLRMELSRKNRLNEKKRTLLTLDAWDSLYAACRAATIKTAPMTFEALEAECDLSTRFAPPHPAAGHFDGPRAFKLLAFINTKAERTKADKDFYRAAEAAQRAHKLPDGCAPEEFAKRALAFITKINPNLAQQYDAEDAADYVVNLMPAGLREAGRRTKTELKQSGQWGNLMAVAARCRALCSEEKAAQPPKIAGMCATAFDSAPRHPKPNECLLGDIFSLGTVARHTPDIIEYALGMLIDDLPER